MANSWVRLWVDMPTDPKFRTIAKVSKQPLTSVISMFVILITDAANANERGRTHVNDEDIASALDLEIEQISSIREAMQGRVLDGNYLTGWDVRQPLREDNSAERSKAWREKQKTERNRTQQNATELQDKIRVDKNKDIKDIVNQPKLNNAPYSEIIKIFHEELPSLQSVKEITDKRKRAIKKLWDKDLPDLENWRNYFKHVSKSKFLMGQTTGMNGRSFKCTIDFLINYDKFINIYENKYHG
jgi:hypothetical protein